MSIDDFMDRAMCVFVSSLIAGLIFITFVVPPLVFWSTWKKSVVQSEVYRRQGIDVSPSELFWGAKPILPNNVNLEIQH